MAPPDLPGRTHDQYQSVRFDLLFAGRAACQSRRGWRVSSRIDSGHESHRSYSPLPSRTYRDDLLVLALRGLRLGSGYYSRLHYQRWLLGLWTLMNIREKGWIYQFQPPTLLLPLLESSCWRPVSLPVLSS